MVQERRGMLRVWNVSLVITTFLLTLFGTFMTRSGIVQSVHAFGQDPILSRLFTIFMVATLVVSFGFVIYRLPLLKARNELDSWVSREAAFMFNNWILLFSAFFVLFATMFPTLSEAVTGERITVGPPFFNQWMIPIGLAMLLLTGIGPLLAWRKSTIVNMRDQFLFPTLAGLAAGGVVVALGVRIWSSGLCFAFSGFVMGTILQEYWRGARVRQQTTGTDLFTALVGLVGRNKRRYGGYLVHVGIVLMFLGFAGEGFKQKQTLEVTPGHEVAIGDFNIRFEGLKVTDDGRKQMVTGEATVFREGAELTKMYPARWYFRKHEDQPTTEVAIRRSFSEDLYIAMVDFDLAKQQASVEIYVNPLINWLWFGFGVLAIGTFIALLPERAFAFAEAKVPVHAATASLLLLALVLWPAAALAQDPPPRVRFTQLEERLRSEVMCTCGCRRSLTFCGMANCHGEAEQMARMREYIAQGKSHDEVLAAFVNDMGAEILMSPPDSGFNRLAWLFPYLLGAAGLVTIVMTARRWVRPAAAVAGGPDVALDPALDARLDDELRDLD
jgi:cytochrome c-type biogenesis protein CcmF